jgi:hypothetical protein
MKPGYYLVAGDQHYGPIVADDPKKDTFHDPKIMSKVTKWAATLGITWEYVKLT